MARALLFAAGMTPRLLPLVLAAGAGAILASCTGDNGSGERTGCDANPLDQVLCEEFEAAGYEPIEAAPQELCTRLFVDLVGVRPSKAQIDEKCAGRSIVEVVRNFQHTESYRQTQRRRWADRFQYSDYTVDVASIRRLDKMVDDLYRNRIGYEEFAEIALTHPGFVGRFIGYGQPDLVADAAFEAFLGRSATTPERIDLANLWKAWAGGGFFPGEDGPALVGDETGDDVFFGYGAEPMVDPFACEAGVRSCASTLLGDASVEFPRNGRESYILASDLTDADWHALRAPGRLLTSLPMFWEAQVDDVLMRYLGYDLGKIRPEARQRLVQYFRATGGDLRKLERVVLTSWAYRQPATELPERPSGVKFQPFAYGPTKPMIAETFLRSVGAFAGEDAGNCDWRYPNLPDWYYPGDEALDKALDDVYPRLDDGNIDGWFREMAVQMGGCPGTMDFNTYMPRERSNHVGLMTAVAQEEAVIEMCFMRDARALVPDGFPLQTSEAAIRGTVRNVLNRSVGGATDAEVEAIVAASLADCPRCTSEAVARDLCAGIASGAEFLFY